MKVYAVYYDNGMTWEDNDVSLDIIFKNKNDAIKFCHDNNYRARLSDELYNLQHKIKVIQDDKYTKFSSECVYKSGKKNVKSFYVCRDVAYKKAEDFIKKNYLKDFTRINELLDMGLSEVESYYYEDFEVLEEYISDKSGILSEGDE